MWRSMSSESPLLKVEICRQQAGDGVVPSFPPPPHTVGVVLSFFLMISLV